MEASRTVSPTSRPDQVRTADGALLTVPAGWVLLPPGDAALTRRVKAAGAWWQVVEKKGRKTFSHGLWAPAETIQALRQALAVERADPRHVRKQEAAARRREQTQTEYVEEFAGAVRQFLRFAPAFAELEARLVEAVTAQATPVGSGTVGRTRRIGVSQRAETAVVAWFRHQTTAYDHTKIARVRGARREVRRRLAQGTRELLGRHRIEQTHLIGDCPLCQALLTGQPPGSPHGVNGKHA